MTTSYCNKILWVNLSTGEFREEDTLKYREWIGGRGLGAYLLSKIPALYESNIALQPIVIAAGPFTGTSIPLGTRTAVTARNIQNGGFCYSNVGGDFGSRLRMNGYDAIVIEGTSRRPVYLLFRDSGPALLPADLLWGLNINAFRESLMEIHRETELSFIGIGRSGEKGSEISCLMVDEAHAAGWGGSGAIFGAKNLKAIVVIKGEPLKVFNPTGFAKKVKEIEWRIKGSEAGAGLFRGGTHGMAGAGGYTGLVPTAVKNLQDEFLSAEESKPMREETFRQWESERVGCYECLIHCLHRYEMNSKRFGKLVGEGMHANSARGFGSNVGVNESDVLFKLHILTNDYGLDVDGVVAALGFALECADNGILDRNQPGGVKLNWGDGESLVKLVEQIGERQGLGELLSKGAAIAAKTIGKGSERYAVTVKGIGINEQGLRSHRAWTLAVMTSTRGGGHLGGAPQTENRRVSVEVGEKLFGVPTAGNPLAYEGKGKLVAYTEGYKAAIDSLGLCYFVYGWYEVSLGNPDEIAELLNLATGYELSGEELLKQGLRTHALERWLSYKLAGFNRKDDTLPQRFFDTVVSGGPYAGACLDHKEVERMLDEYYKTLDWDLETGLPSEAKLRELGLGYLLN
jgi:aldehyde:ferredoxin oxidoreductase